MTGLPLRSASAPSWDNMNVRLVARPELHLGDLVVALELVPRNGRLHGDGNVVYAPSAQQTRFGATHRHRRPPFPHTTSSRLRATLATLHTSRPRLDDAADTLDERQPAERIRRRRSRVGGAASGAVAGVGRLHVPRDASTAPASATNAGPDPRAMVSSARAVHTQ